MVKALISFDLSSFYPALEIGVKLM